MAAYLVVLSHCRRLVEQSYFGEPGSASALRFLDAGSFGVVVFFALSGCTLYTSYGRQPLTSDSVARFTVRRLFRVYPAFLVSLPVYMLVDWLIRVGVGFPDGTWIATFGKPAGPGTVAAYLTLSFNVLGEWDYFNNACWSLPVEFQFYLLFPLFLLLVRWHPLALVAGALGLFALNGALALPGLTFQLAWQFAGGIGIGWLLERSRPILPRVVRPAIMAALLVTALAASLLHHRLFYPRGVSDWTYLGALALPLVFLAAQSRPPVGRVGRAVADFLRAQGEASYSAYLYHNVFVLLAYVLVVGLRLQGGFREAVVYPFLASHLSFRAVERPGIALGRWLAVGSGRERATA